MRYGPEVQGGVKPAGALGISIRYSRRCPTMRYAQSMGLPWEGKNEVDSVVKSSDLLVCAAVHLIRYWHN
jgi:hypothetical protein